MLDIPSGRGKHYLFFLSGTDAVWGDMASKAYCLLEDEHSWDPGLKGYSVR
jgi:hypothetical protein